MDQRLLLQMTLETLMVRMLPNNIPDNASPQKYHVYFQPDENIRLVYPAIVYERDNDFQNHANNGQYLHKKRYRITVIDRNPDSKIPDAVGKLPMTRNVGHNKNDGLYHHIYATYH